MGKPIFTKRSLAIVGCLTLIAVLVFLGVWYVFGPWPRLTIVGAGNYSSVKPYGQSVSSDDGVVVAIWCADTPGPNDATIEDAFFGYRFTPKGFFTFADGKRIDWRWERPRHKGGDFQIDGRRYDLANGGLFLVSAQDGRLRVTQLDADLSQNLDALAKTEPKVAKFLAEAAGEK
jgi:hypothetical protein